MYDFETLVDRRGTTSSKWHMIETDMGPGNEDVIALSVADMEFKPAPEIVEALVHAAQHDIFGYDYATDQYFDALVGWMRRRHALDIKPEWVTLSDGVMPAVNPGISVSRVGGNAQIKAMKKVAGTLKLIYSQYRELQSFAQFGSDLDADTKARLAQGQRIVEVLKQNRSAPVPVEKQVAILYATIHDYLTDVKVTDVADYERSLYEYLDNSADGAAVMDTIRTTGNLDKDTEDKLKALLTAFTGAFVQAH